MPGSRAAGGDDPADRLATIAADLLPQVAMLSGALAVACGAVLLLRRLAGAIETPAGPAAALAACGTGLLLVTIGDVAVRAAGSAASWLPMALTRLGLLMAVAAVSLPLRSGAIPDTISTMLALVVSLVVAFRGPATRRIATLLLRRPGPATVPPRQQPAAMPSAPVPPTPSATVSPTSHDQYDDRLPHADPAAPPAGNLLQRFERLALPTGGEHVRGRLWVVVPEGMRTGYAHVGFCPPLAASPTVEVTTDYDGVEAVVSAAEVLPWGVRIECRLDEPAEEPIEIPVDILATTSS